MKKIYLVVFSCLISGMALSQSLHSSEHYDSEFLDIDYRDMISEADLFYDRPVSLSQAGMPVGNGRMGSLLWTSPSTLKMQINRVDVFPINCETNSYPRRHSDYANGCGYVDIKMVDYGDDVFVTPGFSQHLSVYDGIVSTQGKGIKTRTLAWHERDVIAVEVTDSREKPTTINVDLRMLRFQEQFFYEGENFVLAKSHAVKFQTKQHFATSTLNIQDGRITLKQVFEEGDHYNASAIAISILGRESIARYLNRSTVQLTAAPGQGKFTILIASASSFDLTDDIEALALEELKAAEAKGFEKMLETNKGWWHDYWQKGFIDLHSEDGRADYVEKHYTYFLYLMGSSSLGEYPPRFINAIWSTTGDQAHWGSQFWWWNQSAWFYPLPPTNRFELLDPMINMVDKHYDSYALAAREQWGSKGIFFPETVFFDGFEDLPDDIAQEMKELYLVRKPWEEKSDRFMNFVTPKLKHNSRYNWSGVGHYEQGHWIIVDKGHGPFGHVTHIFSPAAKLGWLCWLRYEYTMDESWLREVGYPIIKGALEFYRNFPNLKKDENSKYNIYHVNNSEPIWNAQNTMESMAAMHGLTPILIRASEILEVDEDMRPVWKELVDNLADFPSNKVLSGPLAEKPKYWIRAVPPAEFGDPKVVDLEPAKFYDLITIATEDEDMIRTATNSYNQLYPEGVNENTGVFQNDRNPITAAHLGLGEDLKHLLPNQLVSPDTEQYFTDSFGPGILPNRITLQAQIALDYERYGNNAYILHAALLQSVPPAPGEESVNYIFPSFPKDWNATYKLAARGGFLITSSIRQGEIGFVEIMSRVGGECRISNPWNGKTLTVYRNGKKADDLSGEMLILPTKKGEVITLFPVGKKPGKISVP